MLSFLEAYQCLCGYLGFRFSGTVLYEVTDIFQNCEIPVAFLFNCLFYCYILNQFVLFLIGLSFVQN